MVLENNQTAIHYYQIDGLNRFIFDSLIGWFPAGSKIYIFIASLIAISSPLFD